MPIVLALLAGGAAWPGAAAAQDPPRELEPPRIDVPPRLEEFLGGAPPPARAAQFLRVDDFVQREPRDNEPPTQPTVAWLAYDAAALYVVFACHDDDPSAIRARLVPRERVEGDDWVHIVLDTFADRQRAYVVATNPRGIQWDAVWTEGEGMDSSFDALYQSDARVTADGWVAWFRIPFASLRFPVAPTQRWGLLFGRGNVRLNEETFWPSFSTRVAGRLTQGGVLTGLDGASGGGGTQLIPTAVTRLREVADPAAPGAMRPREATVSPGLDAKIVPREDLVIDATLNPDFSQVESDQPQVVLNERFEVFFPERRPFFLENLDVFQTPLNLVFTRRIGDPRAGVRLTGRHGPWAAGALVIDDEAPGRRVDDTDPDAGRAALFGVGRATRAIGRGQVGALVTRRSFAAAVNQVAGGDFRAVVGRAWTLRGQAAASHTSGTGGAVTGGAVDLRANRAGRHLTWDARYLDVSPAFRADAGFVPRTDIRALEQRADYLFRPRSRRVVSFGPSVYIRPIWNHAGQVVNRERAVGFRADLVGQTSIESWWNADEETLTARDAVELTTPRRFARRQVFVGARTSAVSWLRLRADVYVGERVHLTPVPGRSPATAAWRNSTTTITVQPLPPLRLDLTHLFTGLREPSGARIFSTHIARAQANWQFTRELSVRAIVQATVVDADRARTRVVERRTVNTDLLVTYRLNPWTAVFAGYNDNVDDLLTGALRRDARQAFVKLTYLLRF